MKRFIQVLTSKCCLSLILLHTIYAENKNAIKDEIEVQNNRFVVGMYGGASFLAMSSDYYVNFQEIPGDYDKNLFGGSYGVKIGYDFYFLAQHGLRFYVDYMNTLLDSKEKTLGKYNMHTFGLNVDYRFDILSNFGVFAGVGLAYNIINTQYLGNINTFGGSLNLGVVYNISFVEFELRLRYLAYDIAEKHSNYMPIIAGNQPTLHLVDLESPVSFQVGVNFRF